MGGFLRAARRRAAKEEARAIYDILKYGDASNQEVNCVDPYFYTESQAHTPEIIYTTQECMNEILTVVVSKSGGELDVICDLQDELEARLNGVSSKVRAAVSLGLACVFGQDIETVYQKND